MPDETALKEYNAGYFDNAHGGMQTHPLTVAFHSAINLLRVVYVEHFQQQQKASVRSVLEIGPGGAHFARHWMKRIPQTNEYTGVESDLSCHQNLISTGVDTFSSIEEIPSNREFDLVVISHVLEHTDNPSAFVKACTKQLRSGGILFIEVPCNDYQHKESVEPHLLFFDKHPMQLFLNNAGFGNVRTTYHGKTIETLQKRESGFQKLFSAAKNFLLNKGMVSFFAAKEPGLEEINNSTERAVIKPFKAHIEQTKPAWWLRAIAIKN